MFQCSADSTFLVNTGNVRRCNHLSASPDHSTANEILTTLACTLTSWKKYTAGVIHSNEIVGHPKLLEKIDPADRDRRHITVKLFIVEEPTSGVISNAIDAVKKSLEVDKLDVLLLSVPFLTSTSETTLPAGFLALWEELRVAVEKGLIGNAGVCDFTAPQLQYLLANSKFYPSEVQVAFNEETTCEATKALRVVADEHKIRIGTHVDTPDIVPATSFSDIMSENLAPAAWRRHWLTRYTVMDPARSVITNLGYLITCCRCCDK